MPPLYNEKQDVERSSSDIKKDPEHHVHVTATAVDDALRQTMDQAPSEPFTAEAALKLRRKIDKHLLPLMMILYWVQFMDKTTLGNSAILGIRTDTHLDANHKTLADQAVKLCSVSFIHDLVTGWEPYSISHILSSNTRVQNLALQRFPVGKWMSINITCWGIALTLHAACKSFGGLMACRIILGICEGSITAGFMITTSMFYTRAEQSLRVGYWFLMNGTAQIVSGFSHLEGHNSGYRRRILHVVSRFAGDRLVPHPEERAMAIERIKVNQTGVENKVWKKDQFVEALTDYKTWLFALFSCLGTIPNSLTNQRSIIINSFGFSTLQTTLLACVDGVVESEPLICPLAFKPDQVIVITIYTGVLLASNGKTGGYVAALYFVPNILGSVLMNTLPWSNQIGLLFSLWITGVGTTGFVLSLGWLTAVVAGIQRGSRRSHTARGQKGKAHQWIGIASADVAGKEPDTMGCNYNMLCALSYHSSEPTLPSRARKPKTDAEPNEDDIGEVYIEEVLVDGTKIERRVDKAFLDLTDIQNREFRYVL
ncbi:MFS general substrate transporter [Rhizoctonia solani]|uniref:MFS general substrate transporter n=1 Tax=Rhizoctonia solani TaxID=456999 RepID=A0A8H7I4H8_9AGAM|nr:MFS general substrate transporter [Rhizoctonia solani]